MKEQGIHIEQLPAQRHSLLITCFDGWGNALDVSRAMASFLIRKLEANYFARINPEPFYRYDENGEVEREDYYLKGALERSRVYAASDTWYEEIYRSGEVFLRITYQEGQKVKEEFISEGEVVRERRYP